MNFTINIEDPRQEDVRQLLSELDEILLSHTPLEYAHLMSADELFAHNIGVFVCRLDGVPIGTCTLIHHSSDMAEIKRLYVSPKVRGLRVSDAMIAEIEYAAISMGITTLYVETGDAENYKSAHRQLERCGFHKCDPFLDYEESKWSTFFCKRIDLRLVKVLYKVKA